jgi:hypothetical protein
MFHIHPLKMEPTQGSETSATKIWRRGDTQKNTHNIQDTAKVWNQVRLNCINYKQQTIIILSLLVSVEEPTQAEQIGTRCMWIPQYWTSRNLVCNVLMGMQ